MSLRVAEFMSSDSIVVAPSHLPDATTSSEVGVSTSVVSSVPAQVAKAPERVLSIDALRGFDMFWIIGGDALMLAALACVKQPWAETLSDQWRHVTWEGFRFYDLIFPMFLFLVGCVLPYSMDRYRHQPSKTYGRIARRVAVLFLLGLIANGLLKFEFENFRVAGVLQRIALCYGFAALIYVHLKPREIVATTVAILLGYWALMAWVAPPGGVAGDYTMEGSLAGYIDRTYLPGRKYYGFGDNEGLLSTIPAVATALLGVLAGLWIKSGNGHTWTKAAGLVMAGTACILLGLIWSTAFPIIKILWTSSYVLVAGGCSLILLGWFYAIIDVMGFKRWAFFWVVIGMNAITIYVAQRFLGFSEPSKFFLSGLARLSDTYLLTGSGKLLLVAGTMAAEWVFLYVLYRNRLFLRV